MNQQGEKNTQSLSTQLQQLELERERERTLIKRINEEGKELLKDEERERQEFLKQLQQQ
jgi:hypothetical protein